MDAITGLIAFTLYLVSTLGLLLRLKGRAFFTQKPIAYLLLPGFAAVTLHSIVLYKNLIGINGFQFGFFEAASSVAMVISLLILLISIKRRTEILAIVILPIAAITLLTQSISPSSYMLPYDAPQGLKIHVLVSIIAYSLLGFAASMSIVLSLQNRMLHNHHPGGLMKKLPPLQVMEKLLFDFIFAGFIGLTLALLSGFVFLDDLFAQHLVHKTVLSIVAWLVFAILLVGRFTIGWRGRTAIRWTLSGFASLMLAYFGSKFVFEFIVMS
ncbi:MAG: cytochrome C biogenesis protein [endosymbiont of Galathealinum brachiosum]|uniref:Cytochrome C biogenesis protein n=1 Tax=endosymbiont of Galathealinum brachiosum TaxID=2200906 RepID=A0A370D8M9_9GAMM|nr:MAG: cytochrome C biogenesis protein [endosymbiont of Galathealinum brachiosum]